MTLYLEWTDEHRTYWGGQLYQLVEGRTGNDDDRPGPVGWYLHPVHINGEIDPEPVSESFGRDADRARELAELRLVYEISSTGRVYPDGDPLWVDRMGAEWRLSDLLKGAHRRGRGPSGAERPF